MVTTTEQYTPPTDEQLERVETLINDLYEAIDEEILSPLLRYTNSEEHGAVPWEVVGRLAHFADNMFDYLKIPLEDLRKLRLVALRDLGELAEKGSLDSGARVDEHGRWNLNFDSHSLA